MQFLLVDDNPADRELIARHLRQAFTEVKLVEVGDSDRFARVLDEGGFDLVLTDYRMGWTDGLTVLQQVQARMPDVPVIMVTGTGSEEVAVEGMKAGLSDYVLKRNLERLVFSVREALEKAELQRSQARLQHMWEAERALRESEERYRLLFQNIRESLVIYELVRDEQDEIVDWILLDANPAALDTIGRPLEEIRGSRATELFGDEAMADLIARSRKVVASGIAHREELYFPWNDRYYLAVGFPMSERLYVMAGMDITQRVRLETERKRLLDKNLRQSAELEATIEAIADPVFFYLPDQTIARLNRSARRLLGRTPHEWDQAALNRAQKLQLQMPDGMPISPVDLPAVRALRGERLTGFPVRFRLGLEEKWITALTSAAPVIVDGGRPLGAVVVLTDVTELMTVQQELEITNVELEVALEEMRAQEDALREAERKYRELVRHAPAGIYEIDFQGQHFISVNDAMCHLLGYSREELLVMNPFDLLGEEGRALFQSRIAKWLGGETPDPNVEFQVKTKDGRTIHALLNVTFTADEDGRPRGATVVAHDITERKRAEAERERLLAERTAVMESMADGLTLADVTGCIIYHNPASLALHGYSSLEEALLPQEQVVAQWELRDLDGERVPVEEWPMPRALRGEDFSGYELYVRSIDTEKGFIGSYTGTLVRDASGDPLFAMLTVRDITERRQAEKRLEAALEQVRQDAEVKAALLSEVNHRVKNNLSAIVGLLYAERRRPGVAGSPECNRVIDAIIQRVRGLATVHAMLSARGWRPLRLRDLVVEVITSAIEALKDGRVFSLEVSPSQVRVTPAQAHHLALLLNELGTNTLKHGAGQDSIHVAVEIDDQDGQVHLRYRDDGPGFPSEILEGEAYSVGLELARSMVERGLRGELELSNDGGAVAVVVFDVDTGWKKT